MNTKHQISVTYFTEENPKNHPKWALMGIFKPLDPRSPWAACSKFSS